MIKFDEITEKMEKVKQDYFKTNERVNSKIEDLNQQKENGDIAPNYFDEQVQANENLRQAEIESHKEQLNKIYQTAEQKLKDQVGFGESNPAATTAALNNLEHLSNTEREIIADNWKKSGNYIGLKALRENDVVAASGFEDIDEQKDKLNKIYQGKLSVLESESNYSSDTDRIKKLANSL